MDMVEVTLPDLPLYHPKKIDLYLNLCEFKYIYIVGNIGLNLSIFKDQIIKWRFQVTKTDLQSMSSYRWQHLTYTFSNVMYRVSQNYLPMLNYRKTVRDNPISFFDMCRGLFRILFATNPIHFWPLVISHGQRMSR